VALNPACPEPLERSGSSPSAPRPPVVLLCGGRGTRLQEHGGAAVGGGREIPKPLVEIGGLPIVWHVIHIYAAYGFRRFLLATGYRGELIERFVAAHEWPRGIGIECVDTGLDTPTGGRIARLRERLDGQGGAFCVTYSDGLADIDLDALLRFHAAHGALASMTVVRPQLQFGVAELDGEDRVTGFREKPKCEQWINGGFFCFDARVFEHLRRDSVLERGPLERLAAAGQLRAYRHGGFWQCMDTYKDAVALGELWASGRPPWRVWPHALAGEQDALAAYASA
jgi:glucose-1-phosphate cytidylyltransferase